MEEETANTIIQIVDEQKPESVRKLVGLAKTKTSLTEKQLVECILRLQDEGRIVFREPARPIPTTFMNYLATGEARWFWFTLGVACATVLIVFVVPEDASPLIYVRYVLGAIFVLWLPGYVLVKALFPKEKVELKTTANLDIVERVALSIGLSLALVPLVGLLLNYTLWGIRLIPIVLSLFALTVAFATVAVAREHQTKLREPA